MNRGSRRHLLTAVFTLITSVALSISALAAGKQTLTGEVSDSMCGRKHMEGSATECTKACVKSGSKYSLLVGDKVYTLETTDKAALATLDQQAGKNATVTGTVSGDAAKGFIVAVSTVAAGK